MQNTKMLICCGCSSIRFSRNNHYVGPWLRVKTVPHISAMEWDHTFCPDCHMDYELMVGTGMHFQNASARHGEEFPGN